MEPFDGKLAPWVHEPTTLPFEYECIEPEGPDDTCGAPAVAVHVGHDTGRCLAHLPHKEAWPLQQLMLVTDFYWGNIHG